jgi:hypothetical protein
VTDPSVVVRVHVWRLGMRRLIAKGPWPGLRWSGRSRSRPLRRANRSRAARRNVSAADAAFGAAGLRPLGPAASLTTASLATASLGECRDRPHRRHDDEREQCLHVNSMATNARWRNLNHARQRR